MPGLRDEFVLKAAIEEAWELLSNMERLGLCIPGCKKVEQVSENEFSWVVEANLLHTSKTIYARTRATEIVPYEHVSFVGDAKLNVGLGFYKITLQGTMDLQRVAGNETRVIFDGAVMGGGLAASIINKIASGQIHELFYNFEQNVRGKLEKPQEGVS